MRQPVAARPGRRRVLVLPVAGALILGMLAIGGKAGLRINATPSMPCGLWVVRAAGPIRRGEIVTACPPDQADIRRALRRGYIGTGNCPGGFEPLLKPVVAVSGDRVVVTDQGITVDGRPVANTRPLAADELDRRLNPIPAGSYPVPPGRVWLLSGYNPRSFDSRYFGPSPKTASFWSPEGDSRDQQDRRMPTAPPHVRGRALTAHPQPIPRGASTV